jgi:hypothetical protein
MLKGRTRNAEEKDSESKKTQAKENRKGTNEKLFDVSAESGQALRKPHYR